MYDLNGQVAMVTGAGSGLGRAIALRLSLEGATIVAMDIKGEDAEELAQEMKNLGRRALAVEGDVANEKDVDRRVKESVGNFGQIDILVNNAGVSGSSPVINQSAESWDRLMGVNLKGTFLCSKAVAKEMISRKRGRIVNIASIAGKRGAECMAAYCSSKFGVIGFTQVLAKELGRYGITVNAVCPGFIWTPLWEGLAQSLKESFPALADKSLQQVFEERMIAATPLGRPQTPEDIASLVAFLVSEESRNITGQAIHVDGGAVMH
ncbi:MAG: SDR family NAD(P)-dependent oxidoreductase [Deltaproteobacteria bacterium]|nr:SDR family NAD(P)-dependent oxidoreductase [Deltaproteobacteria bacterium]